MSDDKRITSSIRRARVQRPEGLRPDGYPPRAASDTDKDLEAPVESRTTTPPDHTLQQVIDRLVTTHDVPIEFTTTLRALSEQITADRVALEAEIERRLSGQTRWSRFAALIKTIGVTTAISALAVAARALIAHGDNVAIARQQAAIVEANTAAISHLQSELSTLRAQAAADHAIVNLMAPRLGLIPTP